MSETRRGEYHNFSNSHRFVFQLSDILIYSYWGIQMLAKGFAINTLNDSYKMLTMLIVPLALLKIIIKRYKVVELYKCAILVLIAIVVYVCSKSNQVLIIVLTVIALKDINLEKLMKWSFVFRGAALLLKIGLAFAGVGELEINELGEYSFGFGHSNLAHGEFFLVVTSCILWKHGKLRKLDYIWICFLNVFFFYYTKSKAAFISIMVYLVLLLLVKSQKLKNIFCFYGKYLFYFLGIVSYFFSKYIYETNLIPVLGTFGSRFLGGYYIEDLYSFSLFGTNVTYVIDLFYLQLLFSMGIVWTIIFMYGHSKLVSIAGKNNENGLLAYLLTLSLYCLMESYAGSVLYNYVWLFYVVYIFGESSCRYWVGRHEQV